MTNNFIGRRGEDMAALYLTDHGYNILERNYKLQFGEIDIIAEKDGCTIFIEVKTRKSVRYGRPSEYVDIHKQERIKRVAACYSDIMNDDIRFDVIEILYNEYNGRFLIDINHIENAF